MLRCWDAGERIAIFGLGRTSRFGRIEGTVLLRTGMRRYWQLCLHLQRFAV